MYFDSFSEFLQMGRHGFYVWTAYGISLALIAVNLITMARRHRQVRADIQRAIRREQLRNDRDSDEQG